MTLAAIKKFVKENKLEIVLLLFLLVFTAFTRFYQLGYSDYYGDESKTLYWNKSIGASEFLLNQRKGPVQFIAAWAMEKVSGGFETGMIRFPFAKASFLTVPVLYLLVRRKSDFFTAFLAAFLFSANGLYIAFGRTIQYQSFLVLFGLASVLFADYYVSEKSKKKRKFLLFSSGIFLGLAFLSHYDAVFFLFPLGTLLLQKGVSKKRFTKLLPFLIPSLILALSFYALYLFGGYFTEHTVGYLGRRLSKDITSSSEFTYMLYNPLKFGLIAFVFSIAALSKKKDPFVKGLLFWFVAAFITFEFIISNPGTHIHNYILPLIMLSAVGFERVLSTIKDAFAKIGVLGLVVTLVTSITITQIYIFMPVFKANYPWILEEVSETKNQRFIYGFPYKRGWDEVETYLRERGARSFYTTDNVTIGEFYLKGIPSDVANPHYFVHVYSNQEFHEFWPEVWLNDDPSSGIPEIIEYKKVVFRRDATEFYKLEKKIWVDNNITALIYKRVDGSL